MKTIQIKSHPVDSLGRFKVFTQTIGHNSRNIYQICTKVGTEIHFNVSILCNKV